MPNYRRPGVYRRVVNLSQVPQASTRGICAVVGGARRGPVGKRVLVTDVRQALQIFGEPDVPPAGSVEGTPPDMGYGVHALLQALTHSNTVYFTRVTGGGSRAGVTIYDGEEVSGNPRDSSDPARINEAAAEGFTTNDAVEIDDVLEDTSSVGLDLDYEGEDLDAVPVPAYTGDTAAIAGGTVQYEIDDDPDFSPTQLRLTRHLYNASATPPAYSEAQYNLRAVPSGSNAYLLQRYEMEESIRDYGEQKRFQGNLPNWDRTSMEVLGYKIGTGTLLPFTPNPQNANPTYTGLIGSGLVQGSSGVDQEGNVNLTFANALTSDNITLVYAYRVKNGGSYSDIVAGTNASTGSRIVRKGSRNTSNRWTITAVFANTVTNMGQAEATATASGGVTAVTIVTSKSGSGGYTSAPAVSLVGGAGSGAVVTAVLGTGNDADKVASFTIGTAGTGYTSTPAVRVAPPPVVINLSEVSDSQYTRAFNVVSDGVGSLANNTRLRLSNYNFSDNTFEIEVLEQVNTSDVSRETWKVSLDRKVDRSGAQLFISDVINGNSEYIEVRDVDVGDSFPAFAANQLEMSGEAISYVRTATVHNWDAVNMSVIGYREGNGAVQPVLQSSNGSLTGNGIESGSVSTAGAVSVTFISTDTPPSSQPVLFYEDRTPIPLSGGSVNAPLTSDVVTGWDLYAEADEVELNHIIEAGYGAEVQTKLISIAEGRRDCVAILDVPYDRLSMSPTTDMIDWRRRSNITSSYACIQAPWLRIYDPGEDIRYVIPPSGAVAAIHVYTAANRRPWVAPAGVTRGRMPSGRLQFVELTNFYTKGQQAVIYGEGINYIRTSPGLGTVIWGQKTGQNDDSALSRITTRYLINVTEKEVMRYLNGVMFENNTENLRAQVEMNLQSYFDTILARGGAYAASVQCDNDNNPPEVIDRFELHVDAWIQPTKAVEYIQYQTIITRTGADFQSLITNSPF